MKKVLITGSDGFIGKNLLIHLRFMPDIEVFEFDIKHNRDYLKKTLDNIDFVFHLAGVNRPVDVSDFSKHNTELTEFIVNYLIDKKKFVPIILSSSTQAELDNDYGRSKLEAESHLNKYRNLGGVGYIYRFTNVFGKWCKPNYNSVVATFCYNIANGKEIVISDRNKEISLIHVDDIVKVFKQLLSGNREEQNSSFLSVSPSYKVTLGEIADLIKSFQNMSASVMIPNMEGDFTRKLHSTYLSYIPLENAQYPVVRQNDDRGYLFELIKSKSLGQIFISKTNPGITRGNHFHHLKNEKFCVIEGSAVIKFRHLITDETHEYFVNGEEPSVVNILPGYTHSITNTGSDELITLFWANEPFDKENPDTFFEKVVK
ncbi:MAG: NAD-dependent epimerase/dehydratase family protein [Bacteroidales bacterium]|nr:NAD-dependent epimerase/dehydratase family protein [Bacteroidales bacterium]